MKSDGLDFAAGMARAAQRTDIQGAIRAEFGALATQIEKLSQSSAASLRAEITAVRHSIERAIDSVIAKMTALESRISDPEGPDPRIEALAAAVARLERKMDAPQRVTKVVTERDGDGNIRKVVEESN